MHRFLLLSLPVLLAVSEAQAIIHVQHLSHYRMCLLANRTIQAPPALVETQSVAERRAHFEEMGRIEAHNQRLQEKPKSYDRVEVSRTKVVVLDVHIKDALRASAAAYNNTQDVAAFSRPVRNQIQNSERLVLESKHAVIDFHAAIPGYGNMPAGIVIYSTDAYGRGRITVSYHGTECAADLLTDLWSLKKSTSEIGIEGFAHGGFYDRYMQGRAQMQAAVGNLLAQHGQRAQDVEFLVSGHSLGGALASLAAVDLKQGIAAESTLTVVTNGSPRVFDAKAAAMAEDVLKGRAVRIWREGDPIAAVSLGTTIGPGYFTGFKHVGQAVKLAPEAGKGMMAQHSHDAYKRDALSDQVFQSLTHQGFWDRVRGWYSSTPTPQTNEEAHDAVALDSAVMLTQPEVNLPALSAQDTEVVQKTENASSGADFEFLSVQETQTPQPTSAPTGLGLVRSLSNWWYGQSTEVAPAV